MSGRQQVAGAIAVAMIVACVPAAAQAATVTGYESDEDSATLVVRDAGSEDNHLTVTVPESETSHRVVVTERGASPLTAKGVCRSQSEKVAVCSLDEVTGEVYAGGGDDAVVVRDHTTYFLFELRGGPGADLLTYSEGSGASLDGGDGPDTLRGSSAEEFLSGGKGSDRIHGGAGNDIVSGDGGPVRGGTGPAISRDVLDGGGGRDTVSWGERVGPKPITVDLAAGIGGAPGEDDVARSFEAVVTGGGPDRVMGTEDANRLYGRGGEDRLIGRGGRDRLDGGTSGVDYSGGPDRARDRFACGPGADTVVDAGLDPLPRTCEQVAASAFGVLDGEALRVQPRVPAPRRLVFEAICSLQILNCRRRVVLRSQGKVIARSKTVHTRRERVRVPVRLRRPLPARGVLEVRIEGEDPRDDLVDPEGTYRWYAYEGFTYRLVL